MYTICVTSIFSGAHNLRGYEGKCERLHGHNWKVEAEVCGDSLQASGMVMDFKEIKKALSLILAELDHTYLNDMPYFKKNNPTSENMARYIYDALKKDIRALSAVTVWETESSRARYQE
ncbi:MAG: 6-carboxytetrahydropterin synthase QueD [Candidatus Omnitrophica bacterium]|nr:6-carboxytetrahydropterin synthase QueD [Candidatus Omnitrophota bacterium]